MEWDPADKPKVRDAIAAFGRRWPEIRSHDVDRPVFILAAGWRSGSTWLQRMLMSSCFVWGEPYSHIHLIDTLADQIRGFTDSLPEPHFFYRGQPSEELETHFIANLYPGPEAMLEAHLQFFDTLFRQPARAAGATRWGIKEVRLTIDHAFYLKWLFPEARFVFLYRDPYAAFRSFAARRNAGWKWFHHWPDKALTVSSFGRHWRELLTGFLKHHKEVDGLLVKYEDLVAGEWDQLEQYVEFPLSRDAAESRPPDGPPPLDEVPAAERVVLEREVGELATTLGYGPVSNSPRALRMGSSLDRSRCVVLTPVGSHVEPGCEAALSELQNRGYEVRRVRGYAAIDQGRNQMATDALGDGFDETLWIDADVEFHPDDVDRLRAHQLPIVCGIYPQKGRRAIACHVLPGTEKVVFGEGGGLVEILYGATGFLHVRKQVYDDVQRQLEVPLCNERFSQPMVPYFQPMICPDGDGWWYLAEDYAFCERARRAGYKIMADTRIRLKHVGSYGYAWEDAGCDLTRHSTFTFKINSSPKRQPASPPAAAPRQTSFANVPQEQLGRLQEQFAWPADKPAAEPDLERGWLFPSTRELLDSELNGQTRLVLELGSFLGLSTRFIADRAPQATVIAVDHWEGSPEHQQNPELAPLLATLYETFLVNCWEYRQRIIPVRLRTLEGLQAVAQCGLQPELVYIDADHTYDAVIRDLRTTLELFPNATIVGDDYDWEGVRRAVSEVAEQGQHPLEVRGVAWRMTSRGPSQRK